MFETKKTSRLKSGCNPECPGCAHKYLSQSQSLAQKETWLKNKLAAWETKFKPIRTVDENHFIYGPTAFHQLIPSLYNHALSSAEE